MTSPFSFIRTDPRTTLRWGRWPARGAGRHRGTVLLLNGRSEFMEKHQETVRDLTTRRFDVVGLDWRGQGGSSRELQNPQKGYVARYKDYVRDLAVFYRKLALGRRRPLVILAHSMGGHIALRLLHECPDAVDRVVLVSPMLDIHTHPFPVSMARALTRLAMSMGFARHYCIGAGDYLPGKVRFDHNPLTSDESRFWQEHQALESAPGLAVGGVTWGWLFATFLSIDRMRRPGFAKKIRTPVHMVCAGEDTVVSVSAQKQFSTRLPACRMTLIPGARHEILKEADPIRNRFWEVFEAFATGRQA
jgi:lysophospholipase